jgi:3-hydroxyisobutyrate dehydrogenase
MKAGVIGLGNIGGGVAKCLARNGMLSAIYDVSSEAAARIDVGLDNGASPRAIAEQSDVVLIAVFNAEQARAALAGRGGVLAAGRPDVPIILLSTVSVDDYRSLRALVTAAGCELVDCGVTGGSSAASGGLVCLVGGNVEVVERVRPVLDGFAKGVYHMGEAGAGMAGKIARNVMIYGTWLVEHEAFKLARAAGVDPAQLVSVVMDSRGSVAPPCVWQRRDPAFGSEVVDGVRRGRSAAVLIKDLGAAIDLADALELNLPVSLLARANGPAITGLDVEPVD